MAARGPDKKSGMKSETKMTEKEEIMPIGDEDLDAEIEKLERVKVTLEKRKKLESLRKEVRKLEESSSASENGRYSDGELESSALQKHLKNLRTGDYGETSTGSSESTGGDTDHGHYTKGVIRDEKYDAPDLSNTPYKYHVYMACERGSGDSNELLAYLGKGCGLKIYENKMSASLGNDMKKDIENGMLLSRCVVFLWTEHYCASKWKQYEITKAKALCESLREDLVIVLKVTDKPFEDFGRQLDYYSNKDELHNLPSLLCNYRLQPTLHVMPNIGASSALSYYNGYLKVILPDIFQRCFKQGFACAAVNCKAHTENQWGKCECIMPAAYFLIIPYSLKGPANLSEWDDKITDETECLCCTCSEKEECIKLKRGGLERDYSSTVHRLITDQSQPTKFRRFLAEVPNILINLNDMHERVVGLSRFQRRLEAIQFHQHLEQLIDNDKACCGKVHFLFIDDTVRNFQGKIVESISELIEKKMIAPEENKKWFTSAVLNPYPLRNFQQLKQEKASGARRNQLQDYDLQKLNQTGDRKVGQGMVINLRKGMGEDVIQKIKATLECLSLDVFVECGHEGVMNNMQSFLRVDLLPDSKIFLCVLLAHGENGQLCDKDGSVFDFCELVDLVSTWLGNKPIVFILEASERRGVTAEYEDVNVDLSQSPTQPHDGQQTQETRSSLSPDVCDFLGYFSCQPGIHSKGSYADTFIRSLCKHIEEKAGTLDLENIIKAVTEEMVTVTEKMSGSTTEELDIQDHDTADRGKPPKPTNPFVYSTLSKYVDFSQVFAPKIK